MVKVLGFWQKCSLEVIHNKDKWIFARKMKYFNEKIDSIGFYNGLSCSYLLHQY